MITKGIAATTELDRHNCRISKEALENAMEEINDGAYVPGVGIEHDLSVLPIGKTIKGKMVPLDNGEYAAQIEQDIFFDEYRRMVKSDDEIYYFVESQWDNRPFADTEQHKGNKLMVAIDPVNFNQKDFEVISNYIERECNSEVEAVMRKSLIPDPEVLFELLCGTLIFWSGKKSLDKLSESIASDVVHSYEKIKLAISQIALYALPKNRPVTYVFRESEENDYIIELILKTTKTEEVLTAVQDDKITAVFEKIDKVSSLVDGSIAKIQFLYNDESEWEFNYLTTKTGQVLGTEKCYKRTAHILKNVIQK